MTPPARASWRDPVAIAAGVGAVAAAFWLVPASVYIVRWTADGPTRVALLAPGSRLFASAAAALVALAVVGAWTRLDRLRLARMASWIGPFSLLWLWTVPYLPWLADRLPLLLVLAGPIRWALVAVALGAAMRVPARLAAVLEWAEPRLGGRTIFAITFAAYIAFGSLWVSSIGIGGDEPHYLMIAQSLLADGDLKIENNHQQKEYRAFFGGALRPDFMVRGKDGVIYSIHAPGLSVVLLPAYAVAGYRGALLVMWLMAALMAYAVFDLADAIAGRRAALFAWVAGCLTVPFIPAAWLIYPETAGALIAAWSARWVWRPADARTRTCLWQGIVFATLPWLHTKFVVLLAVFVAALAFRLRRNLKAVLALTLPIAISTALWLWFFYVLYGTIDPQAPYGTYVTQVQPHNIPRSLLGLLFDQKFGFLVYSPIYIATIAGAWTMLRRPDLRYLGAVLIAAVALYAPSNARIYMWWGGSSAPARLLVPLVPCVTPMIAVAIATTRRAWLRGVFGGWLLISAVVGLIAAILPEERLLYSDPHGSARLLLWLQAGSPLASVYPTFTPPEWLPALVQLVPWVAAVAAALATMAIASRTMGGGLTLRLGLLATAAFLLVAGVGTAHPEASLRDETARRGSLELLWKWDPGRARAYEIGRNVPLAASQLRDLTILTWRGPADSVALPAGSYEARVWFAGAAAYDGEVTVVSQQKAVFGQTRGPLQNPTTVAFELPSDAPDVIVRVPNALSSRVVSTEIVPHDIVPLGAREGHSVRAVESVADFPRGFIVYVDSTTYPEGGVFWTRGTDEATVLIATGGAARLHLSMFSGPLSGDVRLTIAGKESRVHLDAGTVATFHTDLPRDARLVPLQIRAPGQFRPSMVDPNSDDGRRLGCQVRVELE